MKIKVNGTELAAAIGQVTKLTGAKHVSLRAKGDELRVAGTEKGRSVVKTIPASVKKGGQFTAFPEVLVGVSRNRKEVVLEMAEDGSQVVFTCGKYKSDITVMPYEEISVTEPSDGVEFDMAKAELQVVMDLCSRAQMTAPYMEGAPSLPLLLNIGAKGSHVACVDQYHMASVRSKQVTRDEVLDLILPAGSLDSVVQMAEGEKHRIVFSEAVVYAQGATFELALPLEQINGGKLGMHNVKGLQDRIRSSSPEASVKVGREALGAILENIYAVSEPKVPIVFGVAKGSLTLSTITSYGSAAEQLEAEVEGKGTFKFQPQMVSEVFSKMTTGEDVTLTFLERLMYVGVRNGDINAMFVINRSS